MVPLRLKIDESFFLPEERNGYSVSTEMKRVWAVELDLLYEFSRVCEEHDLKWFVHAGTMLGTVRHKGFIPWDDDIDVTMPRADYDRLCALAPAVFKHPYFFQTDDTDPFFCRNFARLRNSDTTAIIVWEKEYHFPYNQGIFIDIFPFDNLPDDEEELKLNMKRMEKLINRSWQYRNMVHFYRPKRGKGIQKRVNYYLKHVWYKFINKTGGDYLKFLDEHKRIATKHNHETTCRVGEMIILPLGRQIWNREWVENTILLPFEMIRVPIPAQFEKCLDASFGKDWRTPKQTGNYHGQVLFDVCRPYTDYIKK